MSTFEMILLFVGVVLLALALGSGVALFKKALKESNNDENSGNMGTLWLLFLVGLLGGLLFIWIALNGSGVAGWVALGIGVVAAIFGIMALVS